MQKFIILIAVVLLTSCSDKNEETEISPELEEVTTNLDTVRTEAIRETQYVMNDSGDLIETDLMTGSGAERDYSWIPTVSELFKIELIDNGINFVCINNSWKLVRIASCVETSITVMDEGKHCDLDQWKHGYTDWEYMLPYTKYTALDSTDNRFRFKNSYDLNKLPFPVSEMNVVRAQVKQNCSDFWYKHMEKSKTPYDYPCAVGTSAYLFKVILADTNGNNVTKYLKISVAMGC